MQIHRFSREHLPNNQIKTSGNVFPRLHVISPQIDDPEHGSWAAMGSQGHTFYERKGVTF